MEEIIKDLEEQIKICIDLDEDLDCADMDDVTGVLITANQAKQIVEALKKFSGIKYCEVCGVELIRINCSTSIHSLNSNCTHVNK